MLSRRAKLAYGNRTSNIYIQSTLNEMYKSAMKEHSVLQKQSQGSIQETPDPQLGSDIRTDIYCFSQRVRNASDDQHKGQHTYIQYRHAHKEIHTQTDILAKKDGDNILTLIKFIYNLYIYTIIANQI